MACAAASLARSFARAPSATAVSVVRLVLSLRDTVNLPSVIPLSQTSRLGWVQPSRATGTVMAEGYLHRRNVRLIGWPDRESSHDRHADRDAAHQSGNHCRPAFP